MGRHAAGMSMRSVWVPDGVWTAAGDAAAQLGTDRSAVARAALVALAEGRNATVILEAARELHQPSVLTAREPEPERCAWCDSPRRPKLLRRYRVYVGGSAVWLHDHEDPHPTCPTCCTQSDYNEYMDEWPCETAKALGMVKG